MPKRSAADIDTRREKAPERHLLLPGDHVPAAAKGIFAELVASVGEGHLKPVDRPLLEQLAVALMVARELAAEIEKNGVMTPDNTVSQPVKVLKQQQALIGQLASRLRLTTQNRISKDKATTTAKQGAPSVAELYELAR